MPKVPTPRLTAERQRLAERYIPLAFKMAADRVGIDSSLLDDARSAALFGLTQAASRFDPDREVRFARYARHRISHAITDLLREHLCQGMTHVSRGQAIVVECFGPDLLEKCDCTTTAAVMAGKPKTAIQHADDRDSAACYLRILGGQRRHVAECLYFQGLSLAETSKRVGLSLSRVQAIHADFLDRLRDRRRFLVSRHLED